MSKQNKIIYWVSTLWLVSAMVASGVQQIFQFGGFVDIMHNLHFPVYFSRILGVWKLLGVFVILLPGFSLVKEWAYAGFFFVMSGAIIAHLAMSHGVSDFIAPVFLLILTCISWYLRPTGRRLVKAEVSNKQE